MKSTTGSPSKSKYQNPHSVLKAKRILVAPLHWGLGHATRCIPIIKALLAEGFEPILASDGGALHLLKKEFPVLKFYELPSYNIKYSKKPNHLKYKLLKASPHILKTIKRERQFVKTIVEKEELSGIISDNRFGVRHPSIPSVYITHQLNVLSGKMTWFSSKWHQHIISKFNECWVPDFEFEPNLSGQLGHLKQTPNHIKYIGPLSRFKNQTIKKTIDILVILSGPEPQRTKLEEKLLFLLNTKQKKILFIRGVVEAKQKVSTVGNIKMYNYMTSKELEASINSSELIISRSGYTTIMDLAKLGKKAILIPTPGQSEQIYLAKVLSESQTAACFSQEILSEKDLEINLKYSGFTTFDSEPNYKTLFRLF